VTNILEQTGSDGCQSLNKRASLRNRVAQRDGFQKDQRGLLLAQASALGVLSQLVRSSLKRLPPGMRTLLSRGQQQERLVSSLEKDARHPGVVDGVRRLQRHLHGHARPRRGAALETR